VKAALVRGRAALAAAEETPVAVDGSAREQLSAYARLFNARDWGGVRAMIDVRLELAALDGREVLAAYPAGATTPAYYIVLELADGRVQSIRDFKYVPYLVAP